MLISFTWPWKHAGLCVEDRARERKTSGRQKKFKNHGIHLAGADIAYFLCQMALLLVFFIDLEKNRNKYVIVTRCFKQNHKKYFKVVYYFLIVWQ